MKNNFVGKCMFTAALLALFVPVIATAQDSPYRIPGASGMVHIMPTPEYSKQLKAQQGMVGPGVLSYHGGPIMHGESLYAIFWIPATLQDGTPTTLSAKYQSVTKQFLADYPAHSLTNNSTQYNQGSYYFKGTGGMAGFYVDTNPYPGKDCTDPVTGTNCITDADIQAELQRVMTLKGWTGNLNKMFLVFTSTGEGSCANFGCAYSSYCAYHGYFGSNSTPTIYANMPYADPNYCYAPGNGQASPNGDIPSDANVNVASHEITEANTDPELNAWWDSGNGEEIGDLCAWNFGSNTWDSGLANENWNGHNYDLQMEYDNHTSGCVQVGP